MSKVIFISGGARSGKSRYAVELAKKIGGKVVFIATAAAMDEEMIERIRLHKISRPKSWALIEEPVNPGDALLKLKPGYGAALVDCLGLWVSNLLMDEMTDKAIEKSIEKFTDAITKTKAANSIVVSNEVGLGIVPADPLSRRFRDLLGLANQAVAKRADEVFFMQAGIPLKLK